MIVQEEKSVLDLSQDRNKLANPTLPKRGNTENVRILTGGIF